MSVCQGYARSVELSEFGESAQFMLLSVSTGARSQSCIEDSPNESLIDIRLSGHRVYLLSGEKYHFLKPSDPSL